MFSISCAESSNQSSSGSEAASAIKFDALDKGLVINCTGKLPEPFEQSRYGLGSTSAAFRLVRSVLDRRPGSDNDRTRLEGQFVAEGIDSVIKLNALVSNVSTVYASNFVKGLNSPRQPSFNFEPNKEGLSYQVVKNGKRLSVKDGIRALTWTGDRVQVKKYGGEKLKVIGTCYYPINVEDGKDRDGRILDILEKFFSSERMVSK
jgi:hypothetical protein